MELVPFLAMKKLFNRFYKKHNLVWLICAVFTRFIKGRKGRLLLFINLVNDN